MKEAADNSVDILIVTRESQIREDLTRWLNAEGYHCMASVEPAEAWTILQENDLSLVIADLEPPELDVDFLAKTREKFPGVGVTALTDFDNRETAVQALKAGAYGYLLKPLEETEVVNSVSNALLCHRTAAIQQREKDLVLRLVWAVEWRDEATDDHIRRVGLYSAALAKALNWEKQRIDEIELAATMHDIGKVAVADGIQLRAERLTKEEFAVVRKHTQIGARILDGSRFSLLRMAREIALNHHEKWDGSGYPKGLVGEKIPESARIVAIADVYDVLSIPRIYRPAHSEEDVLDIMKAGRDQHFDPRIFDCFLDLLPEFQRIRTEISLD
jgi:putative two-component system response regulator